MRATRNLNNWFVVAAAPRFGKIDIVRTMEVDDIWGYDKLGVMQISCRLVAILSLTTLGHLSSHAARAAEKPMMKAGDAIYGYPTFGGGWAEYVIVIEGEIAAKPASLNFTEAAAVPMGALTAWQALVDTAQVQPGQPILTHGGTGGVSSFAVQIAKARGARVIATASTANQDLLKQLGADVAIDYTKTRFEEIAKDVDAVLDPVGKETLARSYDVVKKGGIAMSLVARPDPVELQKRGIRGAAISVHPDAEDLAEIAHLIDAGKIKPVVTQVLPLSEAIEAQQQAATHHTRGKLVLRIADEPKS